jgi:hypothetical protein
VVSCHDLSSFDIWLELQSPVNRNNRLIRTRRGARPLFSPADRGDGSQVIWGKLGRFPFSITPFERRALFAHLRRMGAILVP